MTKIPAYTKKYENCERKVPESDSQLKKFTFRPFLRHTNVKPSWKAIIECPTNVKKHIQAQMSQKGHDKDADRRDQDRRQDRKAGGESARPELDRKPEENGRRKDRKKSE